MTAFLQRLSLSWRVSRRVTQPLTPVAVDFSEREMAVLRLLASTLSQREIGSMLFISLNTVKTHRRACSGSSA